ncbi:MAG: hypothetical protein CL582_20265 [Alteromonadaceae bacterium]|nr:hypothetical protein [Alteromonadaceae bacterium]|tara:strand:+ start:1685 stop:2563 length:879 start_codon:yes stop_codon:yes gene_type:complete
MKTMNSREMLNPLIESELRKLAIAGMDVEPEECFRKDTEALRSWISSRTFQDDLSEEETKLEKPILPFTEMMMETEYLKDSLKPFVFNYVVDVQKFLRGEMTSAPVWPGRPEEDQFRTSSEVKKSSKSLSNDQEDVVVRKPRGRGRPRKVSVERIKSEKEKAVAELTPPKKVERKAKFKKISMGQKGDNGVKSDSQTVSMDDLTKVIESLTVLSDRVSELSNSINDINRYTVVEAELTSIKGQVSAARVEQTASNNLLGNAILFLINSIVTDGEEIFDLSDIPEPDSYRTLD